MMLRASTFVGLLLSSLSTASAAAGCPSEGLVMGAGKAFTSASKSGSATAFVSAASRYADMRTIALSALGPHRKKLPKAQEAEYVRLAQGYMGRFMAQYSKRFNATGMKVTACSGGLVTATANGGRKIMFRVGGGRVQDVNVSSVWLGGQLRSSVVGVLNRNGGDFKELFSYLRG